jgi:hypothetical protein
VRVDLWHFMECTVAAGSTIHQVCPPPVLWPHGLHSIKCALQADSDLQAYRSRASTLSMMTTGRQEQPEDGPRRRRRRGPWDSHESAVGRLEQLADVGRSDTALRGVVAE